MREEISQLHKFGIITCACCCGHKKYHRTVVTKVDDKNIEYYTKILIPRTKRFYKRDKEGVFYIPEVEGLVDIPKP